MNYIDVNELVISSQDADNTYIALNEYGDIVRTKIAVGGDGSGDVDLSDYYTKYEVDKKIENIEAPEVDMSDYYTKEEIEDIIDEIDLTEFITENELELRLTEVVGDINNVLESI